MDVPASNSFALASSRVHNWVLLSVTLHELHQICGRSQFWKAPKWIPDCISVDYNLDRFRNEDTDNLHLIESHARAQGVCIDPNDAFLTAPKSTSTQGSPDVVMAFTPRHRVLTDDFIRRMVIHQKFRQPLILGIPEDWRAVAGVPGTLRTCEDMLEMARLINSAPVFIGSPSLASAIAEGLKAPRLVDLQSVSNDFPVGPGGFVIPTHIEELSLIFQHLGINGSSIRQSLD